MELYNKRGNGIRTFEDRVSEVFTKQSPFSTIEEYTEWFLSKKAVELTKEAEKLEKMYREFTSPYHEVPMDELEHNTVDIIAVVDNHLDDFGWWENIDTEQFLTIGQDIQTGSEGIIYKQGYARAV